VARRRRYVALLRGINLGARNKLAMADLRALVTELGADDVETYVQSGNVVFASGGSASALERQIEERIRRDHGYEVPVLVRTAPELAKVVADNPFLRAGNDQTKLHVTFLAAAPGRARVEAPPGSGADEFSIVRREVYLHCPDGYGRSKLSNAFFEKQLGVVATTRNWRTVTTLAELANPQPGIR
jgi:uncharacterized protein (DUF1697 family)